MIIFPWKIWRRGGERRDSAKSCQRCSHTSCIMRFCVLLGRLVGLSSNIWGWRRCLFMQIAFCEGSKFLFVLISRPGEVDELAYSEHIQLFVACTQTLCSLTLLLPTGSSTRRNLECDQMRYISISSSFRFVYSPHSLVIYRRKCLCWLVYYFFMILNIAFIKFYVRKRRRKWNLWEKNECIHTILWHGISQRYQWRPQKKERTLTPSRHKWLFRVTFRLRVRKIDEIWDFFLRERVTFRHCVTFLLFLVSRPYLSTSSSKKH